RRTSSCAAAATARASANTRMSPLSFLALTTRASTLAAPTRRSTGAWSARASVRDPSPRAAVALEHLVGFARTEAAGGIIREVTRRQRVPHFEDRIDDAPAALDHVGALEERGVALQAVVEQ